jgi:hypothetical protein
MRRRVLVFAAVVLALACGSLQKNAVLVNAGDDKQRVLEVLGTPGDTQFQGSAEVWQYCQTGAGFGYHDYRVVWFRDGRVTGVTSYKDTTPASSCAAHFRQVRWEEAPDYTVEIRQR